MQIINFLFYYCLILPCSYLPFGVLYVISDGLYWLVYKVFGYRKKVVFNNLNLSFPHKTPAEIEAIAQNFYHHFCDILVESLKAFSISKVELCKRFRCTNPEVFDDFFEQGRSVILVGGHFNNWEYLAVQIQLQLRHQVVGLYQPLKNRFFDQKMQQTRGRFGLELVSVKKVKLLFDTLKAEQPKLIVFGSDQSPSNAEKAYWLRFLNQETAVLFGTEKFAVGCDVPVFYGQINKLKRGFYTLDFKLITAHPQATNTGDITQIHTAMLEQTIIDNPPFWLWTHRRWKHKNPNATTLNL